jgi:predicted dithiol-disulfide oxidoreductase (DUF899 family)
VALPDVVSHEEWLTARKDLLRREKELTRARDALAADRRRLPMVRVEKPYVLTRANGPVELLELFQGRQQLIVQHFMFDPSWDDGCPGCTASVDELSAGQITHLNARRTSFALVSRAPWSKLDDYAKRRGWDLPWYSSEGSTFNYDFNATVDETVTPLDVNFRGREELKQRPNLLWMAESEQPFENPGYSCFLRAGDDIFHTYSVYARGTEDLGGAYAFLDWTALGRQEEWQEPKGRVESAYAALPFFQE